MGRVYSICVSGKYLLFHETGGDLQNQAARDRAARLQRPRWQGKRRVPGQGSGAGRRRDKQEGAAGSDSVPLLFTSYENDFAKGRIFSGGEKKNQTYNAED